jgi:uncharacterized protein
MASTSTDITTDNPYIGTGWSFPPTFSPGGEEIAMTTGKEDIENSLRILFNTEIKERVMQPYYGSGMKQKVFDAINQNFLTYTKYIILHAITYHEARIALESLDLVLDEQEEGKLIININYYIRGEYKKYNFVYPYYVVI